MKIPGSRELFDLSHTLARPLLEKAEVPFSALTELGGFLCDLAGHPPEGYTEYAPGVFVGAGVKIADGVTILPPAVIGGGTELRPSAFLRGNVLIGECCVIGNSTEVKNAVIFDGVQIPHFNYVGDSILGYRAHFGAGVITSNVRLDRRTVTVKDGDGKDAGLKKCGALVGDFAEVGCNTVLCPGAVLGRRSLVYPLSLVRGVIGGDCIFDGERQKPRNPTD